MNVVITGSTRGLGFNIAKEFVSNGDNVVVNSRSCKNVASTLQKLRKMKRGKAFGIHGDVSRGDTSKKLATLAQRKLGNIDIWINNAGSVAGKRCDLYEYTHNDIDTIIGTNLSGTLHGCLEASLRAHHSQHYCHIFNLAGNDSGIKGYMPYTVSKIGIANIGALSAYEDNIYTGIHLLSPGLVNTELLMGPLSDEDYQAISFLCQSPEIVAKQLVRRMKKIARTKSSGTTIESLTLFKVFQLWLKRTLAG